MKDSSSRHERDYQLSKLCSQISQVIDTFKGSRLYSKENEWCLVDDLTHAGWTTGNQVAWWNLNAFHCISVQICIPKLCALRLYHCDLFSSLAQDRLSHRLWIFQLICLLEQWLSDGFGSLGVKSNQLWALKDIPIKSLGHARSERLCGRSWSWNVDWNVEVFGKLSFDS